MRKGLALFSLSASLISFPAFAAEICAPTTVPGPRVVLAEYDRPTADGQKEHVTEFVDWTKAPACNQAPLPVTATGKNWNEVLDNPTTVSGTEVVCTGTGRNSRRDPRWSAYSLRLAFVRGDGHYLGNGTVTVAGNGVNLTVTCKGPWVLMKLPAGSYSVHVDIPSVGNRDLTVGVPSTGQRRRAIRF